MSKDYLTSKIGNDFKFVFLDGKTFVVNLKKVGSKVVPVMNAADWAVSLYKCRGEF